MSDQRSTLTLALIDGVSGPGAFDNVSQAARDAADAAGSEFNAVLGTHLNRSVGMIQ